MKTNTSLNSYYYEPSILRSTTSVTLIVAVVCVCLGQLSFFTPNNSLMVSPIFLTAGLALAAALILEKKSLLGIFSGSLFINLFFSLNISVVFQSVNQIISGFIISFGITVAAYLSSILISRINIGNLPIVNGYSVELIDLFKRLINNAIEFRKKADPLEINITAKEVNNYWQFAAEDNGIGIEEQNTEKIFIIFKRLNNREEYPEIGISLAICKKIIALHGGSIWAES